MGQTKNSSTPHINSHFSKFLSCRCSTVLLFSFRKWILQLHCSTTTAQTPTSTECQCSYPGYFGLIFVQWEEVQTPWPSSILFTGHLGFINRKDLPLSYRNGILRLFDYWLTTSDSHSPSWQASPRWPGHSSLSPAGWGGHTPSWTAPDL